ncbi:AI-2E family transporter [bacterium]|nr:AI-2E family transporter [bacterium]
MFENFFHKYINIKNVIFFVITILFLIFITKIKDIAILFFASYVIACSLNPLVDKLSKKLKRGVASAIVLFSTVLLLSLFFIPIIAMSGHEIKSFVAHIPQYIDYIKEFVTTTPIINKSQLANIELSDLISSATGLTSNFVNKSINISVNFASAMVYFLAALIIIYYFMADKEIVKKTYMSLFPSEMKQKADEIIETISHKIGGYVIAQVATMTSVGIIMAIGLMLIKVEYAILLGLITAVLDIIPVVGPALALIICLITAYKAGPLTLALIFVVFAIAQIAENNLVRPYIFGKFLDLHPLIIYLFLFITAQHLGVVGVIFAPAIAATVCVLIEELYIKSIN